MMPHLNAAHNLARWLIRNPHDAEDAVQEAYLRAFRYFEGFQGGDGRAWLMAVVRNTCMTWLGKQSVAVPFDEHAHGAASDPQTDLKEDPRIGSLRECVEALPREYREVIVLREMQELSYREISQAAGVPIGTVMSRLSRSRVRLLECMEAKS